MNPRQFDSLWIGSIVHIGMRAWRVKAINRPRMMLLCRKLPETTMYSIGAEWWPYESVGYMASQKPPAGHWYRDEENEF